METTNLALYLHIPFCRRRCSYCSFVSYAGREAEIAPYVKALTAEIRLKRLPGTTVSSIYFGGGTPNLLSIPQVNELLSVIHECYSVCNEAEITMEANPGIVDAAYLKAARTSGINRLSLGIQSLADTELRLLGRIHTAREGIEAIDQAGKAGFSNLSLDFIYGIPGRRLDDWKHMLDNITDFKLAHLSLYALTLEDNTPLATRVKNGEVPAPDADAAASEYEMACDLLAQAGYQQYEISNWAQPGAESLHNLAYWHRQPYLGLGIAAHSFTGKERRASTADIDLYLSALNSGRLPENTVETIDRQLALSETLILGLRLNEGVAADDIYRLFRVDLYSIFAAEIAELTALGLLESTDNRLRLTARGRLLGNEVFWRLLPAQI